MPFDPEKIRKEHVIKAAKIIDKGEYVINKSTRYDVQVNGKNYPPKDIMRFAHEQATGEYLWYPGGGEPTNKYLKALGFEVRAKVLPVDSKNPDYKIKNLINSNLPSIKAKNLILYGPPGTGKTYNSIDKAIELLTGTSGTHEENKIAFDALRKEGRIEFVTFHQNYSYEDFMVGLAPDISSQILRFDKKDGTFVVGN